MRQMPVAARRIAGRAQIAAAQQAVGRLTDRPSTRSRETPKLRVMLAERNLALGSEPGRRRDSV
jgi:hypothetical protein